MKILKDNKGFSIIELAIVLTTILVIVGLFSGAYFGIITKSQEAGIIKMASDDLPKAILAYSMDAGAYPGHPDGRQGQYLQGLVDKSMVKAFTVYGVEDNTLTDEQVKARWRGPYLKTGLNFDSNGFLFDENKTGLQYSWGLLSGVNGKFGRTTDGGHDYFVRIRACGDKDLGKRILETLGPEKAFSNTVDGTDECWWNLDIIFHQTY
jgi:hypothetical protein